jgi:hypothetical protein
MWLTPLVLVHISATYDVETAEIFTELGSSLSSYLTPHINILLIKSPIRKAYRANGFIKQVII